MLSIWAVLCLHFALLWLQTPAYANFCVINDSCAPVRLKCRSIVKSGWSIRSFSVMLDEYSYSMCYRYCITPYTNILCPPRVHIVEQISGGFSWVQKAMALGANLVPTFCALQCHE